jgi:hypothetical protein
MRTQTHIDPSRARGHGANAVATSKLSRAQTYTWRRRSHCSCAAPLATERLRPKGATFPVTQVPVRVSAGRLA